MVFGAADTTIVIDQDKKNGRAIIEKVKLVAIDSIALDRTSLKTIRFLCDSHFQAATNIFQDDNQLIPIHFPFHVTDKLSCGNYSVIWKKQVLPVEANRIHLITNALPKLNSIDALNQTEQKKQQSFTRLSTLQLLL